MRSDKIAEKDYGSDRLRACGTVLPQGIVLLGGVIRREDQITLLRNAQCVKITKLQRNPFREKALGQRRRVALLDPAALQLRRGLQKDPQIVISAQIRMEGLGALHDV